MSILQKITGVVVIFFYFYAVELPGSARAHAGPPGPATLAPPSKPQSEEMRQRYELTKALWVVANVIGSGGRPTRKQVQRAGDAAMALFKITDAYPVFDSHLGAIRISLAGAKTVRLGARGARGRLPALGLADKMAVAAILNEGQLILQPHLIGPGRAQALAVQDLYNFFDNALLREVKSRLKKRLYPENPGAGDEELPGDIRRLIDQVMESLIELKGAIKYNAKADMVTDNYVLTFLHELMRYLSFTQKNEESFLRFVRALEFHELVHDFLRHRGQSLVEALMQDPLFQSHWAWDFRNAFNMPPSISDLDVAREIVAKAASYYFEGATSTSVYGQDIRTAIENLAQAVGDSKGQYAPAVRALWDQLILDVPLSEEGPARDSAQKWIFNTLRASTREELKKAKRLSDEVDSVEDFRRVVGQITQYHMLLVKLYRHRKLGLSERMPYDALENLRLDLERFYLRSMENPSEAVRENAILNLAEHKSGTAFGAVLSSLDRETSKPVFIAKLTFIGNLGDGDKRTRERLQWFVHHSDRDIRQAALIALVKQETKAKKNNAWDLLIGLADSPHYQEQEMALKAMLALEDARAAEIFQRFSRNEDVRLRKLALEGLGRIGMDERYGRKALRSKVRGMLKAYLDEIQNGDRICLVYRPDTDGIAAAAQFVNLVKEGYERGRPGKDVQWDWIPFDFDRPGIEKGLERSKHIVVVGVAFPAQTAPYHDRLLHFGKKGRLLWIDHWDRFAEDTPERDYGITYISPVRLGSSLASGRYPNAKLVNDLINDLRLENHNRPDYRSILPLCVERDQDIWVDVLHQRQYHDHIDAYRHAAELMNLVALDDTDIPDNLLASLISSESLDVFATAQEKLWESLDQVLVKMRRLAKGIVENAVAADPGHYIVVKIKSKTTTIRDTQWDAGHYLSHYLFTHRAGGTPRVFVVIQEFSRDGRQGLLVTATHTADPGKEKLHTGKMLFDLFGGNGVAADGRVMLYPSTGQTLEDLTRHAIAKIRQHEKEAALLSTYHPLLLQWLRDQIMPDPDMTFGQAMDYLASQTTTLLPAIAPYTVLRGEFLRMKFMRKEDFLKTVHRLMEWRLLTPQIGQLFIAFKERSGPRPTGPGTPPPALGSSALAPHSSLGPNLAILRQILIAAYREIDQAFVRDFASQTGTNGSADLKVLRWVWLSYLIRTQDPRLREQVLDHFMRDRVIHRKQADAVRDTLAMLPAEKIDALVPYAKGATAEGVQRLYSLWLKSHAIRKNLEPLVRQEMVHALQEDKITLACGKCKVPLAVFLMQPPEYDGLYLEDVEYCKDPLFIESYTSPQALAHAKTDLEASLQDAKTYGKGSIRSLHYADYVAVLEAERILPHMPCLPKDACVVQLNAKTGALLRTWMEQFPNAQGLCYAVENNLENQRAIWELSRGQASARMRIHRGPSTDLSFLEDGSAKILFAKDFLGELHAKGNNQKIIAAVCEMHRVVPDGGLMVFLDTGNTPSLTFRLFDALGYHLIQKQIVREIARPADYCLLTFRKVSGPPDIRKVITRSYPGSWPSYHAALSTEVIPKPLVCYNSHHFPWTLRIPLEKRLVDIQDGGYGTFVHLSQITDLVHGIGMPDYLEARNPEARDRVLKALAESLGDTMPKDSWVANRLDNERGVKLRTSFEFFSQVDRLLSRNPDILQNTLDSLSQGLGPEGFAQLERDFENMHSSRQWEYPGRLAFVRAFYKAWLYQWFVFGKRLTLLKPQGLDAGDPWAMYRNEYPISDIVEMHLVMNTRLIRSQLMHWIFHSPLRREFLQNMGIKEESALEEGEPVDTVTSLFFAHARQVGGQDEPIVKRDLLEAVSDKTIVQLLQSYSLDKYPQLLRAFLYYGHTYGELLPDVTRYAEKISRRSSPSLAALLACLEDKDRYVSEAAMAALGKIQNASVLPVLRAALKEATHSAKKIGIIQTLGRFRDRQAVGALDRESTAESSAVRRHAAEALGLIGGAKAQKTLQWLVQTDPHPGVQAAAQDALLEIAAQTKRARTATEVNL